MRDEYDFSNAKKNPYSSRLRKQITIRLDEDTIDYFKEQANETGITYQNLINLYLRECVQKSKQLNMVWEEPEEFG